MPYGLYDQDVLIWSEQQAALLKRLAAGEGVNAEIDWANVVEEIEDVGRSELHAVQSLLTQAIVRFIYLHREPASPYADHWRIEVAAFLGGARNQYTPSMARRRDVPKLYGSLARPANRRAAQSG